MKKPEKHRLFLFSLLAISIIIGLVWMSQPGQKQQVESTNNPDKLKLYWFIPDGFRSDPEVFNIFKWAQQGQLPNIQKMIKQGSYGYSIPVFPGHTPTNFATLLTGATPKVHGVADGPMRTEGYPLKMVSRGGFSSIAKKVPPIWYTLEQENEIVTLLSVPGSTPPELNLGNTIRGRWGGWGFDFPAVIFQSKGDKNLRVSQGMGNRVFYSGPQLTKYSKVKSPKDWELTLPKSFNTPREAELSNWSIKVFAYIYDSTDDQQVNYDRILFSKDKKGLWLDLKVSEWSDWKTIQLKFQTKNDYNVNTPKKMAWEQSLSAVAIDTDVKIKIIKLGEKDFFRIRFYYNSLNKFLVKPSYLMTPILKSLGPMVDFVDNYPPQLIYFQEDKDTFLEEAHMSLKWHQQMAAFMMDQLNSDVIIHDIYTPNQMLTSRWWLGYIDPKSPRFIHDTALRKPLWDEVLKMYQGIDAIIGEILAKAGKNTYVVLSSDHGAVPLHTEVRLNNLFAKNGLLEFTMNNNTGEYEIDWKNSQAVYLKMDNIYLNPNGLDGNFRRLSGKKYEKLRQKVRELLKSLKSENGEYPLAKVVKWENSHFLDLPQDRVGDLIVANKPGYGWIEEISPDLKIFKIPLKSGYKQAILPEKNKGMWTPFIILGPKIKKNFRLPSPIRHIDQYPTIMKLLGKKIPQFVEGQPLTEIMTE